MTLPSDPTKISQRVDETCAWVALHALPNLGYVTFYKILARLGTIAPFFTLTEQELLAHGCAPDWIAMRKYADWDQAIAACRFAALPQHHLVTWRDPQYPAQLRAIPNPPPVLFGKGNWSACQNFSVAIVGSRKASLYGKKLAFDFAQQLANLGLVITSGLAAGIDTQAHLGCLSVAGTTIAVGGTGLALCYPKQNMELSEKIVAQSGLLLTEFLPHTPPQAVNFPRRNRIISGLSLGVLVVEATHRSGSLITARLANENGREVFAIPHQMTHPLGEGCHKLIQQGAKLVYDPIHILEEFPTAVLHALHLQAGLKTPFILSGSTSLKPPPLAKSLQKLLALLGKGVARIDDLHQYYNGNINTLAAELAQLEVQGWVVNTPQGYRAAESH